ncbi:MAG: nuclear transport factor 2 family protein [Hyphomicrobiales bacterium]|nr:nuclear transport factor 2 family protein [Hyphomicrobiales bacterium]
MDIAAPTTPGALSVADRFVAALDTLEARGDSDPLIAMFADGAALESLGKVEEGLDAPKRFWSRYRDQFDEIRSSFSKVIEEPGAVALIWRSRGRLKAGKPIDYTGVSILELDGDRIVRFQTIYDSAQFTSVPAQ